MTSPGPLPHLKCTSEGGGKSREGESREQIVRPNHSNVSRSNLSLCQFLGDLTQKGRARRIYNFVSIEGVLVCDVLLDTGSEISLVSPGLFKELTQATSSLVYKQLQVKC